MSFNVEGVLFRSTEFDAVEFFCELKPTIPLRLIRVVDSQVWGICSDATSGSHRELVEIARLASVPLQLAMYYGFFSVPCIYDCRLFESGQLTHQQDEDPAHNTWNFTSNVEPLGLNPDVDWDRELETLFRGCQGNIVLEH
ncbi:MAG: hypothetical protein IT422_02000 [Pirellulaceae bacterium]|nr:hypothetical protein [Pirellulaceae bacterium]